MYNHNKEFLKSLEKASEEGVLLYKKEELASPADIVNFYAVCEDMSYNHLEFIVKDENGKLKEMWFGDGKKNRGQISDLLLKKKKEFPMPDVS